MRHPTIHLNGSLAKTLEDDYRAAAILVRDALDAVERTAPNGRDYYPQGPDAFCEAEAEHCDRVGALAKIYAELEALIIAIMDREVRR